jgi:hypothetical protein
MSEPDQRLNADEDSVNGDWIYRDGQMVGDANCRRIEWLIHHHLRKVGKPGHGRRCTEIPMTGAIGRKPFPKRNAWRRSTEAPHHYE